MASVEISSDRELKFERGTRMRASALASHLAGSLRRLNIEGAVVLLVLVIGWQLASFYLPPILFPSLSKIAAALRDIVTSPAALTAIGLTYLRIVAALAIAFAAATAVGIGAGLARPLERAALPLIEVMQGIPAVCWIIFAILWFRGMEPRIAFVVISPPFRASSIRRVTASALSRRSCGTWCARGDHP
jgi:NitT/TauT family transport system permease protein